MALYNIITNRTAVNTLKALYTYEVIDKKGHSMSLDSVEQTIKTAITEKSLSILNKHDLIRRDRGDLGVILSISQKGKEFIEIFDLLIELFQAKEKRQNARIEYHLTEMEKKILVMIKRISNEIGKDNVTLKNLTRELFPIEAYESKSSTISRQIKKLEEIKLVERAKKGREAIVCLTERGEKTIKDQFLMGIIR